MTDLGLQYVLEVNETLFLLPLSVMPQKGEILILRSIDFFAICQNTAISKILIIPWYSSKHIKLISKIRNNIAFYKKNVDIF